MEANQEPLFISRQVDNYIYFVRDYQQEFFDEAIKDGDWQYLMHHADTIIDANDRYVVKSRRF